MNFMKGNIFGLGLTAIIAVAAFLLSSFIPLGAVAIAIIIGIIIGNTMNISSKFNAGITFSEKHVLSFAIALMGVNLNFHVLQELGLKVVAFVIVGMVVTLSSSIVLSRIFKCNYKLALLLGIGNGVCGSSAIAATEKIIGSTKEDVGLSVAIVNFLGTIGIFLLPFIGHIILGFNEINSGVLIGNTLQAVGQVVAAGFSIGHEAGHIATIVKMTRILMLGPLVFVLIFSFNNKRSASKFQFPKMPIFIIGFILFSMIPTFRLLPEQYVKVLSKISHYALIVAMAGIGLRITVKSILTNGKMALKIASIIFLIQILFSSIVIYYLF